MKRIKILLLQIFFCAFLFAGCNSGKTSLLKSFITKSQGFKTITITDSSCDSLFTENNARQGILSIIKNGNFTINGFTIPTADSLADFTVNDNKWISYADGSWTIDGKTYDNYDDAVLALVERIPAGHEIRIFDKTNDDKADIIQADYFDAAIVSSITKQKNGYKILHTEVSDYVQTSAFEGTICEGNLLTESGINTFNKKNVAKDINAGDLILLQNTPDGWKAIKAIEKKGILVQGEDHEFYQIDDVQYEDAMRFSRGNIAISNRCGEFTNALKYFAFMNNSDYSVSLWLVPTTQNDVYGAPAGFTTDKETAKNMLKTAIEQASEKNSASIESVIQNAQSALEKDCPSDLLNYEVYVLYLALHGTSDDIGAKYADFSFPGVE